MTLRMGDGPVANLPPGLNAYAGYVNDSGIGETWPGVQALAKQQNAIAFAITTNGSFAQCADVEQGAMSNWKGYEYGYCSVSNVNSLIAQFGRPQKLWTAHYTGTPHICSPVCWPGLVTTADGTQWIDHGGAWDESLLSDTFFNLVPSPTGGDVPAPTDVTDSWSVPGSDGAIYFDLHADGGLFAYGGANGGLLEYVASGSDGARYHFGPKQTPGIISYPGLPAADRQGNRYFNSFTVLSYNGVVYPQTGTTVNLAALHAAGASLSGA
jgi:hypothetical protein